MIKVILFDCWGTLFTSGQADMKHPFEEFANTIGHSVKDRNYLKSFEGEFMLHSLKDLRTPIKNLLQRLSLQASPETINKLEMILLDSISRQQPYGDTFSTLDKLKKDYRLVLVTNSFSVAFDVLKEKYYLDTYFDEIYTSYDLGMIKPETAFFEKAIQELGCVPHEIIMIGDNVQDDIEPAKSLGIHALLIDRKDRYPTQKNKLRDLESIPRLLHEF